MANNTFINLFYFPKDADHFEEVLENKVSSEAFPGLMEGNYLGEPDDLKEHAGKMFFGMHGSHAGAYPAALVVCPGKGEIFSHPCDEEGKLSMFTTNPLSLSDPPVQITTHTMQFVLVLRGLIETMMNQAAEDIENRMQDIEAEEAKKREDDKPPES